MKNGENLKQLCKRIYHTALPYLRTRRNDIHTLISYRYARVLLRTEPGESWVVLPAVLLHDVGWSQVPEHLHLTAFGPGERNKEINRIHEVEGVRLARNILQQTGYPDPAGAEEILQIIDGHDSVPQAISLADMIVKDADKLFRFSHWGFWIDVERFGVELNPYTIWISQQIEGWFFTKSAKAIAWNRIKKHQIAAASTNITP